MGELRNEKLVNSQKKGNYSSEKLGTHLSRLEEPLKEQDKQREEELLEQLGQ